MDPVLSIVTIHQILTFTLTNFSILKQLSVIFARITRIESGNYLKQFL